MVKVGGEIKIFTTGDTEDTGEKPQGVRRH